MVIIELSSPQRRLVNEHYTCFLIIRESYFFKKLSKTPYDSKVTSKIANTHSLQLSFGWEPKGPAFLSQGAFEQLLTILEKKAHREHSG